MEYQKQTSFTFEIDNFSEKEGLIQSPQFSSGGCEWVVKVYHKGETVSLYLFVANPRSPRLEWKRRAEYSFVLLNESGEELFRTDEYSCLFNAKIKGWGVAEAVPLKKIQEKMLMQKNNLIVKVELEVVEIVDERDLTGNETLHYYGFQVLYSQVSSVSSIVAKHQDFADNVKQNNQRVKTTYMNILLDLIETLNKPPHSISDTEMSNTRSDLMDLTEAGFKLDWLKTKLDEVYLRRKKTNADDVSRVQELEEHIKNLKVELDKVKTSTSAGKVLSLDHTVSDLKDELNKEKVKSDTFATKVLSLEQTVSDLKDDVSHLKDEMNKEKLKSDTSSAKVFWLEQTVLYLRAELNKEKGVVCSWEVLDHGDLRHEK